jgi:bifunctional non-homologous end joining protein LigD
LTIAIILRLPARHPLKHQKTIDTVILGYRTEPQFALVVDLNFPTVRNKPVAVIEFGFKPEEKAAFRVIAQQIRTKKERNAHWIEQLLCCRIQYLERTEIHHLRITSF